MRPIIRSANTLFADLLAVDKHFPVFLCPALSSTTLSARPNTRQRRSQDQVRNRPFTAARCLRSTEEATISSKTDAQASLDVFGTSKQLPLTCPGCGAITQVKTPDAAGFYTTTRRGVRDWLKPQVERGPKKEDQVLQAALEKVDRGMIEELGLQAVAEVPEQVHVVPETPYCDRCHNLTHHREGNPIIHPSIHSIEEIIADSPHFRNHIYHVVDAADFPMSVIPNLQRALKLPALRTQNRRSKSHKYTGGRIVDVSFIITRADLLAPKLDQVNAVFPYLQDVLRDALGRSGHNVRLGNVRCVSSKRNWWTKELKEDIWQRGGAGWMVGKVNVGKSNLFEQVYPKGRVDLPDDNLDRMRHKAKEAMNVALGDMQSKQRDALGPVDPPEEDIDQRRQEYDGDDKPAFHNPMSLLPPAQDEVKYPTLPIVSDLPGTTAAPIRVPYGSGRGELIDLPGIARSTIDEYVAPRHRESLIMKSRLAPEKIVIKPNQTLLLGGLVNITPSTPDLIYIAHPFITLSPHLTSTLKAADIENHLNPNVPVITLPTTGAAMKSAGKFVLEWDVTKKQSGTLTARDAGKWKVADLPFVIYSTDIVIESLGWIEITCNVRKRYLERRFEEEKAKDPFASKEELERRCIPTVEVRTPEGKFVMQRKTMNASFLGGKKKEALHLRKGRPRMSMKLKKRFEAGTRSSVRKQRGEE